MDQVLIPLTTKVRVGIHFFNFTLLYKFQVSSINTFLNFLENSHPSTIIKLYNENKTAILPTNLPP